MRESEQSRVAEHFDPGSADTVGQLAGGLTGRGGQVFAADGGEGHEQTDDEQGAHAAGAEDLADPGGGARTFRHAAASAAHAALHGSSDRASLRTSAFGLAGNDSKPRLPGTRRARTRSATGQHSGDLYGTEVSRDLVSRVTEAVVEDMQAWQSRPFERRNPIMLIDAIVLNFRVLARLP